MNKMQVVYQNSSKIPKIPKIPKSEKPIENHVENEFALFIKETPDMMVCFDKISACFVHIPKSMFRRNYYQKTIETKNIVKWISLINRNKQKYRDVNYLVCYQLLQQQVAQLLEMLLDNPISSNVTLDTEETCVICLDDYQLGSQVISFHQAHQKHVCCQGCYQQYQEKGLHKCPICRLDSQL